MDAGDCDAAAATSAVPTAAVPTAAVSTSAVSTSVEDRERLEIGLGQIVAASINDDRADTGVVDIVAVLVGRGLADWAGISLVLPDTGAFHTIAHTDDLVRIVDSLQFRNREGPCLDAVTHTEATVSDHPGDDPRWPVWGPHAVRAGITAVLSVPLHSRRVRFGAMNLYRGDDTGYGHDELPLAQLAATHVSALLAHQRVRHNLEKAIDARTIIGQAQGVLMERFHLGADQAFSILRRYSQDSNTKLHVVAEELVATRRLPGSIPPPGQTPGRIKDF